MAVKHDGSIDEQFYTDVMKVHPDFVKALKAAKDGAVAFAMGFVMDMCTLPCRRYNCRSLKSQAATTHFSVPC